MTHPNKNKGNNYERELVKMAQAFGIPAERAWGSDGRSFGEIAEVDPKVSDFKVQAKRKKKIPDWLRPVEGVDVQVFREDRGQSWALMSYDLFLKLTLLHENQDNDT